MSHPDNEDDEFHAEPQTVPTMCSYSGFVDEPASAPRCRLPAAHAVRCSKCGALIARCVQHGGARGTQLLLAHHEARCGVVPPVDDCASDPPPAAVVTPPADEDDE